MLSNSSQEGHVSQVLQLGAGYFIKSNLSLEDLVNRIADMLATPA